MHLTEFALLALSSLFAILDPIAVVPAFLAMTANDSPESKLRMARLACSVAAGVLILFAAAGNLIFKVMGITLPAFELAGSVLLLRIALDMLYAKRSAARETEEEVAEGAAKEDIAITPLGVPMLAGPGSITTALILFHQAKGPAEVAVLFVSYRTGLRGGVRDSLAGGAWRPLSQSACSQAHDAFIRASVGGGRCPIHS
jgi:multiple antibiotic resistance protein